MARSAGRKHTGMKKIWLLLIFSCAGCSSKPDAPVIHVGMINDKHAVKISGLDNAVLQEISRDSAGSAWQSLIPVYRMPADTDLKSYQPVQPGVYQVKDGAIVFTPDTPFVANQAYFVRYYKFDTGNKVTDFIMGHTKPGSLHYSDLVFK